MNLGSFFAFVLTLLLVCKVSAVEFGTAQIAGKKVTYCRVNVRQEKVQLFHRDETGAPLKRFERLVPWLAEQGQNLVFAMNAGMYHGNFDAVGLFVADGKEVVPLNLANGAGNFFLKPNGVLLITEKGVKVVESSEYPKLKEPVILATQSGPLLVRDGRIHPAFNPNSVSRLIRNGVGVQSPEVAVFAVSDDSVNFYEFATLFRDVLHCPDALFLDGTVSSLYAPALKRADFRMDLGPIIGVTKPITVNASHQ